MMMMMALVIVYHGRILNVNDVEVSHHTGLMVFQYMTMVHPTSGPIVWPPGNFNFAPGRKIYSILPANEFRRFAIDFQNLKEESVEMEGMIH